MLYRGDLEAAQKKPFTLMDDFTDAIKRVLVSGIDLIPTFRLKLVIDLRIRTGFWP